MVLVSRIIKGNFKEKVLMKNSVSDNAFLADPGKARGCSTTTAVTNSVINSLMVS